MYTPAAFTVDDRSEVVDALRRIAFGHLVTNGHDGSSTPGLTATALPFVIDDGLATVRAHLARANRQWRSIDGTAGLLIVPGVDSYVSPRWYPSKAEHGKVVPTWNYELIQVQGTIEVHHDPDWKLALVSELTDLHEQRSTGADGGPPWKVTDAPAEFITGQLRAIVGVQLNVTGVEAKQKLSQNRPEPDRIGTSGALAASDDPADRAVAALMDRASSPGRSG